jgi:hypothetical protein
VKSATRAALATVAITVGVAAAGAQAPAPRRAVLITEMPAAGMPGRRSPVAVLERLASFDANGDRRISRDELPERMQGLIERGDKNADALLDAAEIEALVTAAAAERTRFSFRAPSMDGLAGVVNDLKLPPPQHERALAIVAGHKLPPGISRAPLELYQEMKALLDEEDYDNFVAATERLMKHPQTRVFISGGVSGGIQIPSPIR